MPGVSLELIGIIVGIYVIVHGVALIAVDFAVHNVYVPFYGIMSGILSIIVGVILLAMPNALPTIFAIALGIWVILSSVNIISVAVSVRKHVSKWYLWLILGIIDLLCGIIVLFNPFASSLTIVVLGGIVIMVHSVITIVDMVLIRKDAKDVEKAIEASVKDTK